MQKERPLWERLYREPAWYELVRKVGYAGCTYRQLAGFIEELGRAHGKERVESASYHCVTFDGQMTATPKPLARVSLRKDVRKLSHQLLGPDPEIPATDLIADIHERANRPEPPPEPKLHAPKTGKRPKKKPTAKPQVPAKKKQKA